jgi:two-component system, NtrC family, response regulator AtoC
MIAVQYHPRDVFQRLRDRNILLVDDDECIRDSVTMLLEAEGCHCQAVETAEQALKQIADSDVDIVIADYRLPGMDGLELLRRLQQSHPESMKVFVSAYGDRQILAEARGLGADEVLEKPLTAEALHRSLARLMDVV